MSSRGTMLEYECVETEVSELISFIIKCATQSIYLDVTCWDFPRGPEAKTSPSQNRGPRFNPWSENLILYATATTQFNQINK